MIKGLLKPKRLECDRSVLTNTYGRFIAEPLERGFGVTLGNSLRRVLLSSLPGAAVTNVWIKGVYHEFSTIPGVLEDVTEIILNLKQLVVKLEGISSKVLSLNVNGPKKVTAGDISPEDEVQILNPDLHIATLNEEAALEMKLMVKAGRSYVPAEFNQSDNELTEEDNQNGYWIPIDAIFSPVRKANFSVEDTRVGQSTDFDRLILEVSTNGTMSPEEAVMEAANILKEQLDVFVNFEEKEEQEEQEVDELQVKMLANLDKSIDELELSVRSYNCLINSDIKTVKELIQKTEAEILKTRNFGRKSLNEIKEVLGSLGLHLGMSPEEIAVIENQQAQKKDMEEY
jgi:DNA-directed RNA polymerase subunit alpha